LQDPEKEVGISARGLAGLKAHIMLPTNDDADRESTSRVEHECVFPPETDIPIAFESVPIGSLKAAADSFEPRRKKSSGGLARLRRRVRAWRNVAAATILPMFPGGFDTVRRGSLLPFAVGVLSGIVGVSALRSIEPQTKISDAPPITQSPLVPLSPELASAFPQLSLDDIGNGTLSPQLPEAVVEEPAPPPVSQQSKPRRPVSGPQFRGRLIIDSEPRGASVMINQRLVGTTPLELSRYPASSYAVRVEHEGYQRWSAGVLVPADKVTRVHARLQKTR
jgi:hypothetical protein